MNAKKLTYETRFVEHMPLELEEGVLYMAPHFDCSMHKCMCGCGEVVCTPLGVGGWNWNKGELSDQVSLSPSVGNFYFNCKSHYFLKNGQVKWC